MSGEVSFSICNKRNTCFDCDNTKCWHCGDKGADCPKWTCDNPKGIDNCDDCEFIDQYIEDERKMWKEQE